MRSTGAGAVWRAVVITAIALLAPGGRRVEATSSGCRGRHWVGVWATSPSDAQGRSFVDQTLRLVVNPTLGGTRVRVRLSNRYGSEPVTFGAAAIARRAAGAAVVRGTTRMLRFGHTQSVTVEPGGEVVSRPVRLAFHAFEDLAVSVAVRGASGPSSEHATALQTSYVSAPGSGDQTRATAGTTFTDTVTTWPFVTDVEVRRSGRVGALVAVGDSITDGVGSPGDQDRRYPDLLARRLAAAGIELAVQNEAIGGNQVLRDGAPATFGPALLARLDRDVLDQAGARIVLLMEGTNDIGLPPMLDAARVIDGLRTAVDRMHAVGLRVILGTLLPSKNFLFARHDIPDAIAIAARNQINSWILAGDVADGVVDFHAALGDPDDPDRLRPEFDSGDHLHPNAAGYAAMADAVDFDLLTSAGCR